MKPCKLLLFFVLSCSFQLAYSQMQDKKKPYYTKVFKVADVNIVEGYLYQLKDSSIFISNESVLNSESMTFQELDVRDIQRIEFRRKAEVGKRMLIGGAVGFALGALIGYATGAEGFISEKESALMGGVALGIAGGLIYGFAGGKVKVNINGSKETYYQQNRKLKRYTLVD